MAKATPTLEAAGMVVIDTSTPTTAPDLARPRAMIPADPAAKATTNALRLAPMSRPVTGRCLARYGPEIRLSPRAARISRSTARAARRNPIILSGG
jgi:hypothetical protein